MSNVSLKQKYRAYISPNYHWKEKNGKHILVNDITRVECSPSDIDVKISIYEDRVKGWFLDHANLLKSYGHTGFVILQIAVSYIEGNQQFREGESSKNKSEEFFIKGMRRIFEKEDVPRSIISHFYKQVRCGLFHNGMTGKKVFLSSAFRAVAIRNSAIYINPHIFLDEIKKDFSSYIGDLKNVNNNELRENFEKMFYFVKKDEGQASD